MVLKSDKEKVKTLLAETIRLLCKNGLNFKAEFCVEALVGITLDRDEEFFLSIKETVKSDRPVQENSQETPEQNRSIRRQRNSASREVKTEPVQRKRSADEGSTEIPSLTLGDMQESEQSFWSAVTGDGGGENSDHMKRKRIEPDDDSNSNVIEIKGEPGSDSDDETEGGNDTMDMADNSYAFGPPGMMNQMATQGMMWDHMQNYQGMAGPSGMSQTIAPDGQMPLMADVNKSGNFNFVFPLLGAIRNETNSNRSPKPKGTCSDDVVVRNILMSKGKMTTPRIVTMNIRGKKNTTEIVRIMEELDAAGVGHLVKDDPLDHFWSAATPAKVRAVFLKKPAEEIMETLWKYNLNQVHYTMKFNMDLKDHEKNYNWAISFLTKKITTKPVKPIEPIKVGPEPLDDDTGDEPRKNEESSVDAMNDN